MFLPHFMILRGGNLSKVLLIKYCCVNPSFGYPRFLVTRRLLYLHIAIVYEVAAKSIAQL